jgi:hypothetical protein
MSEKDNGLTLLLVVILAVVILKPELLDFTKTGQSKPTSIPTNHATGPGQV